MGPHTSPSLKSPTILGSWHCKWASPQVFCRVKGLNSNHWSTLTGMRFRDRRHTGDGPHGSIRPEEVERLQRCNPAFYVHYVSVPPTSSNQAALTAIGAPHTTISVVRSVKTVPEERIQCMYSSKSPFTQDNTVKCMDINYIVSIFSA